MEVRLSADHSADSVCEHADSVQQRGERDGTFDRLCLVRDRVPAERLLSREQNHVAGCRKSFAERRRQAGAEEGDQEDQPDSKQLHQQTSSDQQEERSARKEKQVTRNSNNSNN